MISKSVNSFLLSSHIRSWQEIEAWEDGVFGLAIIVQRPDMGELLKARPGPWDLFMPYEMVRLALYPFLGGHNFLSRRISLVRGYQWIWPLYCNERVEGKKLDCRKTLRCCTQVYGTFEEKEPFSIQFARSISFVYIESSRIPVNGPSSPSFA